jgi:hypothetical protein
LFQEATQGWTWKQRRTLAMDSVVMTLVTLLLSKVFTQWKWTHFASMSKQDRAAAPLILLTSPPWLGEFPQTLSMGSGVFKHDVVLRPSTSAACPGLARMASSSGPVISYCVSSLGVCSHGVQFHTACLCSSASCFLFINLSVVYSLLAGHYHSPLSACHLLVPGSCCQTMGLY